jgi:hypothetical protein
MFPAGGTSVKGVVACRKDYSKEMKRLKVQREAEATPSICFQVVGAEM